MKIIFIKSRNLDKLERVEDRQAASFQFHRTADAQFTQHAVDVNRRHAERIGQNDL